MTSGLPPGHWRAMSRRRTRSQLIGLLAAPWGYALFLVMFLFYS